MSRTAPANSLADSITKLPDLPPVAQWRLLEHGFAALRDPTIADYMPVLGGVAAYAADGALLWLAWVAAAFGVMTLGRLMAGSFDLRTAEDLPAKWSRIYAACTISQAATLGVGAVLTAWYTTPFLCFMLLGPLSFTAGRAGATALFMRLAQLNCALLLLPLSLVLIVAAAPSLQALGIIAWLQFIAAAALAPRAARAHYRKAQARTDWADGPQANRAALTPTVENFQRLLGRDRITGLPNRLSCMHILAQESARAFRAETPLSLLLVAWDEYEAAQQDGDGELIARQTGAIARRLGAGLSRPLDRLASLGQGRFAVLLPFTDALGAAAVARRLQAQCRDVVLDSEGAAMDSPATISIGAATYCGKGLLPEAQLMQFAEEALTAARKSGGDQITRHNVRFATEKTT